MFSNFNSLPDELPLFPLTGALLLPKSKLPLNIFESKYLKMLNDALKKEDRLILTLIAPTEWNSPYHKFIAEVRQLGDSTWEEIKKQEKKE